MGGSCCRGGTVERAVSQHSTCTERHWRISRGVYTKPGSAFPVERRNNNISPGWKCGNALWRDVNRTVHGTQGWHIVLCCHLFCRYPPFHLSSLWGLWWHTPKALWSMKTVTPDNITKTPTKSKMECTGRDKSFYSAAHFLKPFLRYMKSPRAKCLQKTWHGGTLKFIFSQ